jgi:hypothetical protein
VPENHVTDDIQERVDALTTRTARIELLEEGIVVARIGDDVQTLDDARANLEACARLAAPDRKPLLVDIRAAKPLMPEVRHTYMGERLDTSFAAMGLLVRGSPLGRTMGNVYLRIARPGIPTRIFAQEPKALAWLREIERK